MNLVLKLIAKEKKDKTGKLDISYAKLKEIPQELLELIWLTELDLTGNQINTLNNLPKNIKILNLGANSITKLENLPDELQTINIGGNKISKIENLPDSLLLLNIYKNNISKIDNLPIKLIHLYLNNNQINDIESLEKLTSLQSLNLSSNQVNDIRVLKKLTKLQNLNLHSNQINDITPLRNHILNKGLDIKWNYLGQGISIADNPLTTPPPEIVKRGRKAVVNWFTQLEKNKLRLFESKILIVGQGAVGKTWLLSKITTGIIPAPGETTPGINIKLWNFGTNKIKEFKVNFWDFGGQEIYHATHQFFLSRRSLYMFIWDARKDEDRITSFDYWLNVISLLSNNSPIIVVMNKSDERSKAIEQDTLKKRFPNIVGFHSVSALKGTGIEDLKDDLKKQITLLPHVGSELPKAWQNIRKSLEKLDKQCISNLEYYTLCEEFDQNEDEADFLSDYYHDLGVFLHFRDNLVLNDIVFLKPEWATNAVYKIIDTKEVVAAFGKFSFSQLKSIWKEYDNDKYKYLVELMKKFELCFQFGNSKNYIVPELLRPEFPNLQWDYADNLQFEYEYSFMPAGIITRFIARQHKLIKSDVFWRHGLIMKRATTEALIISDSLKRKIHIWLKGVEAKELLYLIRTDIENINESLNNPEVKEMYPCNCAECKESAEPYFYDSDMLTKFKSKKIQTIQCQHSGVPVDIENLLGLMRIADDIALEKILEFAEKSDEKLETIIRLLNTINENKADKDSAIDDFFKIVKLDAGIINFGELLKKILTYKKKQFI